MTYDKDKLYISPAHGDRVKKNKRRSKRLIKCVAAFIAGYIIISVIATEVTLSKMFSRPDPVVSEPFDIFSRMDGGSFTGRGIEFASGGNILKGYVIVPPSPAALVLLVHGFHGSADMLDPVALYFVRHSYAVMAFDGTASGRSTGKRTAGLQQQRYDIRAAIDSIEADQELSALPLILFGHSAGAYGVAVEAPSSGAAACVCVAGFEAPLGTMLYWAEEYTGILADAEFPFLYVREYAVKGKEANESASAALERCSVPALVIHSENDSVVPLGISLYDSVADRGISSVDTILVTDSRFSGHTEILFSHGKLNTGLFDEISEFTDAVLAADR